MHLYVDPINYKATLVHGGGMTVGTLEFGTYNIVEQEKKDIDILDVVFYSKDLKKTLTIRDFLKKLLTTLWEEEDGFSGKRPFGNGGWKYDLYGTLCEKSIIDGRIEYDEDGDILESEYDCDQADRLIYDAIRRIN